MEEIFERETIKIRMYLNGDRSVILGRMMHVEYVDDDGQLTEFDAYPDAENGRVGTINWQFGFVESIIKFNNTSANVFLKHMKAFFEERPNLSTSGISLEAGLSSSHLGKILKGERSITYNIFKQLQPILIKYGLGRK